MVRRNLEIGPLAPYVSRESPTTILAFNRHVHTARSPVISRFLSTQHSSCLIERLQVLLMKAKLKSVHNLVRSSPCCDWTSEQLLSALRSPSESILSGGIDKRKYPRDARAARSRYHLGFTSGYSYDLTITAWPPLLAPARHKLWNNVNVR